MSSSASSASNTGASRTSTAGAASATCAAARAAPRVGFVPPLRHPNGGSLASVAGASTLIISPSFDGFDGSPFRLKYAIAASALLIGAPPAGFTFCIAERFFVICCLMWFISCMARMVWLDGLRRLGVWPFGLLARSTLTFLEPPSI